MEKRIIWIDALKGVLILLVVLGHSIQDGYANFSDNYIWNLIYSFHMATFMTISGYVTYKPVLEMKTMKKRVTQLLLPFFIWTLIKSLFSPSLFLENFWKSILNPDNSFWFLWVLFFITLLFHLADEMARILKCKQEYLVAFLTCFLTVTMVLFNIRLFGFQFISYYFIFFSIGFYLNKYPNLKIKNKYFLFLLFILWLLSASFWNMHELPFFLTNIPYVPKSFLQYLYRTMVALFAIFLLLSVSPKYLNSSNAINKIISYLGNQTLGIYIIHLIIPFNLLFTNCDYLLHNIYLFFALRLLISLAIVRILSLWNLTSFFLLGKKTHK